MEKHSSSATSTGSGFALVEALTMLAILSVIATIAFLMFVAGDVETDSENGDHGVERQISRPSEPPFAPQADSPGIPH